MKKYLFTFCILFCVYFVCGQRTHFNISLNSGVFAFYGNSAESVSQINFNDLTSRGYTNNPYGKRGGLCLGLSVQLKRVSKLRWVYGLDAGMESMTSRIHIDAIHGHKVSSTYELEADGVSRLTSRYINFFPFIGSRVSDSGLVLDVIGGIDVASCLSTFEDGKALSEGNVKFTTHEDRKTIGTDVRPRFQISIQYKQVGFYTGLSIGLVNYRSGFSGGVNECYSRVIRFGWLYQII